MEQSNFLKASSLPANFRIPSLIDTRFPGPVLAFCEDPQLKFDKKSTQWFSGYELTA